jgi:hypothetical protein
MNTITLLQSIGFCAISTAALLGVGYAILYANNIILRLNRDHAVVVFLNHFVDQIERTLRTRQGRDRHFGHKFTSTEDDRIIQLIDKYGIENVIFMVPMLPVRNILGIFAYTSSSDNHSLVPCMIEDNEQYNYKSGYKIRLVSIYTGFGTKTMYTSDFSSLVRDARIQFLVRKDASAELESLFQDYDSGNYALVRLPSRQAIAHEIRNSKNEFETANALSNLLRRNVIDDPEAFMSCLNFKKDALNVSVKTDRGLLETGTWDKISHSDALDKLNAIYRLCNVMLNDIRDLAGLNVSGELLPDVIECLESIREISGAIHKRDDGDETADTADTEDDDSSPDNTTRELFEALGGHGDRGFILALLSQGMFGADVAALTGWSEQKISNARNKRKSDIPAWIYDQAGFFANTASKKRRYSDTDVEAFRNIFDVWSEGHNDWFEFDLEKIDHHCDTAG